MTQINTHGLKIDLDSLSKAAENTVNWERNSGWRTDIFYDRSTGEVWTVDLLGESWKQYRDADVHQVASTAKHHTAQWIADRIADYMSELKRCEKYL